MNIYEYIATDHQFVLNLFKQFNKTSSINRKKNIMKLINAELTAHLESEKETFYRALNEHHSCDAVALQGCQEHATIEHYLDLIMHTEIYDSLWEYKVLKLQELMEYHVREEETVIHNRAKKILPEQKAKELKNIMVNYKKKLSLYNLEISA